MIPPDIDVIYKERRYELSGEGLRFFDLVRTGQAATYINGFVVGKHELFPIPQVEIDLAGGNWAQNPGYSTLAYEHETHFFSVHHDVARCM